MMEILLKQIFMCIKSKGLNASNKMACRVSSLCDISTGPTIVNYTHFSTRDAYGEYIKAHVGSLIRTNLNQIFQQNAIFIVWPYLLRYLEFLDRTGGAYGKYIKTRVGSLIRLIKMNFGQIFNKMQFYMFGNISPDI